MGVLVPSPRHVPRDRARLVSFVGAQAPRLVTFATIGLACTLAFAMLYSLLRRWLPPIEANALSLGITMLANFLANRRLTFRRRGNGIRRQFAGYAVVYGAGLLASSLVLWMLLRTTGANGPLLEIALAIVAGSAATVLRYVLLSVWVFRERRADPQYSLA